MQTHLPDGKVWPWKTESLHLPRSPSGGAKNSIGSRPPANGGRDSEAQWLAVNFCLSDHRETPARGAHQSSEKFHTARPGPFTGKYFSIHVSQQIARSVGIR